MQNDWILLNRKETESENICINNATFAMEVPGGVVLVRDTVAFSPGSHGTLRISNANSMVFIPGVHIDTFSTEAQGVVNAWLAPGSTSLEAPQEIIAPADAEMEKLKGILDEQRSLEPTERSESDGKSS